MEPYKFYKHKNCVDMVVVPIFVESDEDKKQRNNGDRKLRVAYYTVGNPSGIPRSLGLFEDITITDEQAPQWEEYPKMSYGYAERYVCSED